VGSWPRVLLPSLVAALALLAFAPLAHAAVKGVVSTIGEEGTLGGQFKNPRGVAVNGASGNVYVADSTNNRIQEFSSSGAYIRAWGTDVVSSGAGNGNEMQAVMVNATAGQFKLAFGAGGPGVSETGDLAFDATAAEVQAALNALTNVSTGGGSVAVSGGPGNAGGSTPYLVNFNTGPLAGADVPQMTAASGTTPLSGGTGTGADAATVSTFAPGGGAATAFEVCEVAALCKAGSTAATGGGMSSPQGIAVNQTTGNVYVTDQFLLRVDEFDANGNFIRSWGRDVVSSGPHNNGTTNFEICTAADVCKAGVSNAASGAFATTFSGQLAIAPGTAPNAGNVLVADPGNRRVDEYTAAGAFVRAFGWNVNSAGGSGELEVCTVSCQKAPTTGSSPGQFANSQPTRVAVDSSGAAYTVESAGNNRVQRFNPSASLAAVFAQSSLPEATLSNMAINPTNDHVFVTSVLGQGGGDILLLEFDSFGALLNTYGTGAGFTVAGGLGLNPASTASPVYLSSTSFGHRVFVFDEPTADPVATIAPVTTHAGTSATFDGEVNPTGLPVGYHFEYSPNGVNWIEAPSSDVDLGFSDFGLHPASQSVEGLTGSQPYHVRLVAEKHFLFGTDSAGSATSSETTFTTDPASPAILPVVASGISDTGASLNAKLDPQNETTAYHFEYGTGDCATHACTALPSGETGGGGPRLVTRNLSGLEPATTYHFRLVATNSTGTTVGPDRAFTTFSAGAKLPDNRAYEMVSPPEKNGANVEPNRSAMAAVDGDSVVFGSLGSFADASSSPVFNYYLAQRDDTGWSTQGLSPPLPPSSTEAQSPNMLALSDDLAHSLMATLPNPAGGLPGTQPTARNAYRRDLPDGPFVNLTPIVSDPGNFGYSRGDTFNFAAADHSMSVVGFNSEQQITPDGPPTEIGAYVVGAKDQTVRLAAVYPDGTPVSDALSTVGTAIQSTEPNPISADGSQLIFQARNKVYLRRNPTSPQSPLDGGAANGSGDLSAGSATVENVITSTGAFAVGQRIVGVGIPFGAEITAVGAGMLTLSANALETRAAEPLVASGECEDPSGGCTIQLTASSGSFEGASVSGDKVLLATAQQLLASDTDTDEDLYLYEPTADSLRHISVDENLVDGIGAGLPQVIAFGEDADEVYLTSGALLVSGQPELSGENIYAWHDDGTAAGTLSYVTTLDPEIESKSLEAGKKFSRAHYERAPFIQASVNGRYLLFTAETTLGSYDNVKPGGCGFFDALEGTIPVKELDPNPNCSELYRYDIESEHLDCVSCDPSGEAATGDAELWHRNASQFSGIDEEGFVSHNVDNSGRVFFNTEDGLTPEDRNGLRDVYQWENGEVSLISTAGKSEATFANATPDGNEVFFNTAESLVGWDIDSNVDLYDASVDGGLPEPPPAVQSCEGDACQPPPLSLNDPTPSSSSFFGPGNPRPRQSKPRCPKGKRKVRRQGKTRCVPKKRPHKARRTNDDRRAGR